MKRLALRIIGFLLGFGLALGIEFALLFLIYAVSGLEFLPRGPAWLLIPIASGLGASSAASDVWQRLTRGDFPIAQKFRAAAITTRLLLVIPIFWLLCVATYVYVFEPYGYYMGDADYRHMIKVMLFPIAVFAVGMLVFKKVISPRQ